MAVVPWQSQVVRQPRQRSKEPWCTHRDPGAPELLRIAASDLFFFGTLQVKTRCGAPAVRMNVSCYSLSIPGERRRQPGGQPASISRPHSMKENGMQERPYDPSEPKASPWEVYVFEEGCWVSLQTFGDEDEARAYLQNSVNQSGFPADYYAVIGPNDQVMPPAPASYSPEGDY